MTNLSEVCPILDRSIETTGIEVYFQNAIDKNGLIDIFS